MTRLPRILLVALGLLLSLAVAPAIAAQSADEPEGGVVVPSMVQVHQVDATGDAVEIAVLASDYGVASADVSVSEDGSDATIDSVRRASEAGRDIELIFVLDISQRTAQGDVFENMRATLASEIRRLPSGTRVAVVSAGDTATIRVGPTTDREAAARAVEAMTLSEGSALFNAISRAGELVNEGDGWLSTVVVFTAGADDSSAIGAGEARVNLVQEGAQMVAVSYDGGEVGLAEIIDRVGGVDIAISSPVQVEAAMIAATEVAEDRLLVSYEGATATDIRGDATLRVGELEASYSYPGGTFTNRPVALAPRQVAEPGGIAFFRSDTGLYVAVALAFLGIGLAIYSLGLLFASGETSLQGLLDRYSGEGDGAELDDTEQALVQTALVKRAVEFSESFAEDRGFLGKVEELLERAKLPLRPGEAMSFFMVAIVLFSGLGFVLFGGVLGMIATGFISGVLMIVGVRFKAKRRIRSFEKQLPDTLILLAGTLRAGYSLPQGLEAVSNEIADPMGYELRRVMTEARLGREIEDALGQTAERLSSPDFAWAVMAIGIQREVGGNLNELLMTVADTMIARERLKGEVAALTAEGKMSAMILGGLPPGLGFVMWIMNPEYINVLFTETLGKIFIGLGFVSATIGMAWMKKVITINV